MAVNSDNTFALQQFRQDIAEALEVDGYFYGRAQSTGDATGGEHRVRWFEPDDSLVPVRCLWIINYCVETTYANGNVRVVGKLGGTNQEDRLMLACAVQNLTDAQAELYLTNGGDLSGAMRARGWWVPSFGPGNQRLIVDVFFTNTNLVQVDCRIYGYYMNITLGS